MLAHSRQIKLRNGVEVTTPLLIPSFSSAASTPREHKSIPYSRIHSAFLTRDIAQSLLISAYDIEHDLLTNAFAFKIGFRESDYAWPKFLMIDNGWYEKRNDPQGESSSIAVGSRKWEQEDFERVIDTLDQEVVPAVVSWDCWEPYEEQIQRARSFFAHRSHLASVILLKPPGNSEFHELGELSTECVALLQAFDLVGVTEKEIGDSIHDRFMNIIRLRKLLSAEGVSAPIHIFGGLDPQLAPLYFACGAEIFDGLGWLRYAYHEGMAVHRSTGVLLNGRARERSLPSEFTVWRQNLEEIRRLSENMRRFAEQGEDWEASPYRSEPWQAIVGDLKGEMEA